MSDPDLCIPRNETARPRCNHNRIIIFCLPIFPISTFMYLWVIYIFPGSACLFFCCCQIKADLSWDYINRKKIHECRNWEQGRRSFISGNTSIGFSVQCGYCDLNISWSLYVLAVVAPVPGGAEPLGAQHPLEHTRHLHAVGRLHSKQCRLYIYKRQSHIRQNFTNRTK